MVQVKNHGGWVRLSAVERGMIKDLFVEVEQKVCCCLPYVEDRRGGTRRKELRILREF